MRCKVFAAVTARIHRFPTRCLSSLLMSFETYFPFKRSFTLITIEQAHIDNVDDSDDASSTMIINEKNIQSAFAVNI